MNISISGTERELVGMRVFKGFLGTAVLRLHRLGPSGKCIVGVAESQERLEVL